MRKTFVGLRLDPKVLAKLERLAKADDRNVSYIIRKAIDEYIRKESK